ncbi:MAG: thymidine phosphorylase [Chloroflexota bacterium]
MNPVDIIIKKRDGLPLSAAEIEYFIDGFVTGTIPDYQAAAWAMAVYFQGMSDEETTTLTQAMAASGDLLNPRGGLTQQTLIVDKHSSGGIGDKTTLAVGPIVAACGLPVGKMSGRGLGFTGGTIDKLESIPGWTSDLPEEQFERQLQEIGLVIAGQTVNLAPADKLLYGLRDVTGTVGSLPLIASSIMSKKLAAGADAIVLDVKCGSGAFMGTLDEARALAQLMVAIGTRAGRRMTALITQMDQPLGSAVGNSLEVKEAITALHGQGPSDFQELVKMVAAEMLYLGQPRLDASGLEAFSSQVQQAISSGAAFIKFCQFVEAQGGDVASVRNPLLLPQAPIILEVKATELGTVSHINSAEIGLAVMEMGGGRQQKEDEIDPRVGVLCHAKVGSKVQAGDPICIIHAASPDEADTARQRITAAYTIQPHPADPLPILYERIT